MDLKKLESENRKEEPLSPEQPDEKEDKRDSKAEGIANDIVGSVEPLMRAGEKLFNLDRSAVGMKLVGGLMTGRVSGLDQLFGAKKRTRLEKFKEAFEIFVWLALLIMIFFWLNLGMARFMGLV